MAEKAVMRHVVGKANMYMVFSSGAEPRTYMERSISSVIENLLNAGQIVPVAEAPVSHTNMTEIRDPSLYASVRVVDEKTGGEVALGSVLKDGDRLAYCVVTHAVSGWHMPGQYEAVRRRLAGQNANEPEPVGADEVLVGPEEPEPVRNQCSELPLRVKPPVFM